MEESVALLCLQAKGWHRSQSTAPLLLGRAWLFAFTAPLSRGKGHLLSLFQGACASCRDPDRPRGPVPHLGLLPGHSS